MCRKSVLPHHAQHPGQGSHRLRRPWGRLAQDPARSRGGARLDQVPLSTRAMPSTHGEQRSAATGSIAGARAGTDPGPSPARLRSSASCGVGCSRAGAIATGRRCAGFCTCPGWHAGGAGRLRLQQGGAFQAARNTEFVAPAALRRCSGATGQPAAPPPQASPPCRRRARKALDLLHGVTRLRCGRSTGGVTGWVGAPIPSPAGARRASISP